MRKFLPGSTFMCAVRVFMHVWNTRSTAPQTTLAFNGYCKCGLNVPHISSVTVDPGSKPDQKLCSAEIHAKIREKEFRFCTVHWYIASV